LPFPGAFAAALLLGWLLPVVLGVRVSLGLERRRLSWIVSSLIGDLSIHDLWNAAAQTSGVPLVLVADHCGYLPPGKRGINIHNHVW
jgi:hypothetical protein